jgi:uncharacterized membrane protein
MFSTSTKGWRSQQPLLLLLLWTILGAGLRLANLDGKPPWTDEFATLGLSLGNSFKSVPLDRVISFQDLLAPLIFHPSATVGDVVSNVFVEDHHPPTYFALAHLWMRLFPTDGGYVNLWAARALPALFGIITIPVVYICSYFIFRSQLIANCTAAMLALSPYGVFISQEARHYSLAILWITISVSCVAIACQHLMRQQKLPIPLIATWIIVNNFGMATHYFFSIALTAEAFAVGLFGLWQVRASKVSSASPLSALKVFKNICHRLSVVLLGTAAGVGVWFWLLACSYDSTMTEWIKNDPHKLIEVFNPLFQVLGVLIPMISLLLVEVTELPPVEFGKDISVDINLPVVILSGILMLIFFIWVVPMLKRALKIQWHQPQTQIGTISIVSFTASAIGLYLFMPWLTGMDITRGARYHFVYFPGVMMVMGLALAACWQTLPSLAKWVSGKQAVSIVLLMGFVSGVIVSANYGYHKYYRAEQIAPMIQDSAPIPVLIATTHNSLVQVGEMMGLAWEMRRTDRVKQTARTQFLFAHQRQHLCEQNCPATEIVRQTIDRIDHPIDLWLLNFNAPVSLPSTCNIDKKFTRGVYGYEYKLYHCQSIKDVG